MQHKKRKWKLGYHAVVVAMSAGTMFQVSSCTIDEGGVISALADTGALTDLRNQWLDASLLGHLHDDGGSDDASTGEAQ